MARNRWSVLAIVATGLVAACSGTGAYELCKAKCDAELSCNFISVDQNTSCHSVCDANQTVAGQQDASIAQGCLNYSDIRHQQLSCFGAVACGMTEALYDASVSACQNKVQANLCTLTPR